MGLYSAVDAIDDGACPYCLHNDCQCEEEENQKEKQKDLYLEMMED